MNAARQAGDAARLATLARKTLLALSIAAALAVDLFGLVPHIGKLPSDGDFAVFWTAPRMEVAQVYDFDAVTLAQRPIIGETDVRPYLNPPTFLWLLEPLGRLPVVVAFVLWAAFTGLLYLAACRMLLPASYLPLVAISPAALGTALAGQVALLIAAAVIAGLVLMPRRPWLAGALFAVAAMIKPQAVMLLPVALIAARQWPALAATLATGLAGGLLSVLYHGVDAWLAWLQAVAAFRLLMEHSPIFLTGVSPASAARLLGLDGWAAATIQGVGACLGLAVTWAVFRRSTASLDRLAALAAGCLLATPYAMVPELALIVPCAVAMLLGARMEPLLWAGSFFALSSLLPWLAPPLIGIGMLIGVSRGQSAARTGVSIP